MNVAWLWGSLGGLVLAILAWFHGRKSGDNAAVARQAQARQEAQQKVDAVEKQASKDIAKIEAKHAIDTALADVELRDQLRKPVEDSDVERVFRQSDEDFEVEHSDR